MSYKKELLKYMETRREEINKILTRQHNMIREDILEIDYKKLNCDDFYMLNLDEEITQENDLENYIKVLMRWK